MWASVAEAVEPLRLAGRADHPPYMFRDEAGAPRGVLVDLWNLWSRETGREIRVKLFETEAPQDVVRAGRADVAMGLPRKPDGWPGLSLSRPLLKGRARVFVRSGMGRVKRRTDLLAFRVGVVAGGAVEASLPHWQPGIALRSYPDLSTLTAAALEGEVAVMVADSAAALFHLGRLDAGRKLIQSPIELPAMDLCAGFPDGEGEALAAAEAGFAKIPAARRRAIVRSWSGVSIGHRIPWQLLSVGTLLLILVGGGIAVWIWNDQLRRRIEAATADLREKQRQLMRSEADLRQSHRRYKTLYDRANSDKELYRSLLASSADAILIADQEDRVRYVSPSFTELFGWTLDALQDRPLPFSNNGDARDHRRQMRELMAGDGTLSGVDATRHARDDSPIAVSVSASRYADHRGRHAGTLWVLRDMRETRRLEAELRQSQKMEAMGTLAGGIAHDFNNILSAIIGFADLARMQRPETEEGGRKVADYLERLLEAAHRAKDLVRQILAFTRQSERALMPTDLGPLVKETLGLLRASFPAPIEIESHVPSCLGSVNADPTQIHQVLMNLCTNARQALGDGAGGRIAVSLAPVPPNEAAEIPGASGGTAFLRLTVADNGPGIDPAIRHRIFDPYFTTKGPGEGTGLGLSVVHGIVQRHNGHIVAENRPEGGTEFRVYLPLIQAEARRAAAHRPGAIARGRERILLVDDEPALATLGRDILGGAGYRVTAVTDSREALGLFLEAEGRFDLVLTDMSMPGMTGADLAQKILARRPDLPVFLYTGHSEAMSPERAAALGIRNLFMKPLDYAALAGAVRSVFDGKPPPPSPIPPEAGLRSRRPLEVRP
ncbi:MAG: ATP-binding protein [Desulfococcaceae bacterium]